MKNSIPELSAISEQELLQNISVRLLGSEEAERASYTDMMCTHHYLKSDVLVGEQLRYVVCFNETPLALLSWSAAAKHLKYREQWMGWSNQQRRSRLAFVANNARFLILPGVDYPNLASRALALCMQRLSTDWQESYGHPILVVESFVDSQLFRGTCYKAQGWQLLGATSGYGRTSQDYYENHNRPKQLWVKELRQDACKILSSEVLPEDLQSTEDKIIPITELTTDQLRDIWTLCKAVPEWRKAKGRDYPLPCLLAIIILASLCGVIRGQRDLAAFAFKLTQPQLRALRSYKRRDGKYDYPKETTFQRVLAHLDPQALQKLLHQVEVKILGKSDENEVALIAIDGKALRGSTPNVRDEQKLQLVSAYNVNEGRVMGTVMVEEKTNEIPAARELINHIGPIEGNMIMCDALHTNQTTLRIIHQDQGADYLLPVKNNHEGLARRVEQIFTPPPTESIPISPTETKSADASTVGFPPLDTAHSAPRPAVRYRRKHR